MTPFVYDPETGLWLPPPVLHDRARSRQMWGPGPVQVQMWDSPQPSPYSPASDFKWYRKAVPKKPHSLPPLDKETGEAVWRICEPNRPMPQAQPPAAPITPEKIAALRDALAKATPGEWTVEFESSDQTTCGKDMATVYSGRSDRFHGLNLLGRLFDLGPQGERDLSAAVAAHNLAPKLLAALDAAEAQAVEFAWDALAFAGVCVNSESGIYNDCANSSAESAAEYLTARGLLRKTGERTWQRVEGESK